MYKYFIILKQAKKLWSLLFSTPKQYLLSLFILKSDPNILGITIENSERNVKTTYRLSMLDIDVVNVDIPPQDFNTIITMPSSYLQKIIRDMHNLAEYIEIKNENKQYKIKTNKPFFIIELTL